MNSSTEEVIIEPNKTEPILAGLLRHKELIYFFTWREFKLRYKEATLGVLWVIFQPLLFMLLVNFIIVQRLGRDFGDGSVPSGFLIFLGFTLWQLFEPSFAGTINSFLNNQALYKKLYFPKILPAIAAMISRLLDFFIGFALLFVLGIVFGHPMTWQTLALVIPGVIMLLLTAYGGGLFLGSLNIKYRDIKQLVPFMMRILFFGTPIIWPLDVVPESWQPLFFLNPGAAVIETMRQSWYDPSSIHWNWMILPFITMTVSLILGTYVYKRTEREMVDIA
jgi:lipopolysaccharide transport system permease protein